MLLPCLAQDVSQRALTKASTKAQESSQRSSPRGSQRSSRGALPEVQKETCVETPIESETYVFHWFYNDFLDSRVDPGGIEDEPKTENVDFPLVLQAFSVGKTAIHPQDNRGTTEAYPAPRPPVEAFLLVFLVFSISLTTTRTLTAYGC